jgi:phosphinothricin acetyltransferase
MAPPTIRPARPDDLPELTDIYNHYVVHTPITFDIEPVSTDDRRRWLDAHRDIGRHRLIVAADGQHVLGYASTSPFRERAAYDTTVEASIYCRSTATGRGIGGALYAALFDAIADEDIHRIVAGITLPNAASVALHEKFGFQKVGTFSANGRKFGTYWDVAWFERPLRV